MIVTVSTRHFTVNYCTGLTETKEGSKKLIERKKESNRNLGSLIENAIIQLERILFLKLLEAQLINYHKGDKSYPFLNLEKVHDYDDLNSLFFSVLARKQDEGYEKRCSMALSSKN